MLHLLRSPRLTLPIVAIGLFAFASFAVAGDKTAKVKDAWGQEVEVKGYDDGKNPGSEWFVHDPSRPQPPLADKKDIKPNLNAKPPANAIIIFDGKTMNAKCNWKIENGYAEIAKGGLTTNESFASAHYHIEWAAPKEVKGDGQGRGNSGIIIMGKYEIQVLDSWKNATYPDGMAGSVYGQNPPKFNASVPPGEWNSYDITWLSPKFKDGELIRPASVTVIWNGVKVQENYELVGVVSHRKPTKYSPHEDKLPLNIQDHGNPIRFRNIWITPLE
ncbi:MAG: DUF1080 domain-containing protein [Phycisphaeraceae bacterium]